jgi:hypothetical protein
MEESKERAGMIHIICLLQNTDPDHRDGCFWAALFLV